jgi:hypothetical protein
MGRFFCLHLSGYTKLHLLGNGPARQNVQPVSCNLQTCLGKGCFDMEMATSAQPCSGCALVVLEPNVSSAVRQAQNRSLIATAAALPEQMLFGFL